MNPRDFDSEISDSAQKLKEITALSQKIKIQISENELQSNEKNALLSENNTRNQLQLI